MVNHNPKPLQNVPIGTMVEIDWHENNTNTPFLFIITKITPDIRAANGELTVWSRVEFFCIKKGKYYQEYTTTMQRWLENDLMRIIHIPESF